MDGRGRAAGAGGGRRRTTCADRYLSLSVGRVGCTVGWANDRHGSVFTTLLVEPHHQPHQRRHFSHAHLTQVGSDVTQVWWWWWWWWLSEDASQWASVLWSFHSDHMPAAKCPLCTCVDKPVIPLTRATLSALEMSFIIRIYTVFTNYYVCGLIQHGGVWGAVHAARCDGQRSFALSRKYTASQEQIRRRIHPDGAHAQWRHGAWRHRRQAVDSSASQPRHVQGELTLLSSSIYRWLVGSMAGRVVTWLMKP